jgi:hypothetical protein
VGGGAEAEAGGEVEELYAEGTELRSVDSRGRLSPHLHCYTGRVGFAHFSQRTREVGHPLFGAASETWIPRFARNDKIEGLGMTMIRGGAG